MKVAFYTLGCKTNQFETQALEKLFSDRGHEVVSFTSFADAYIINTCSVTSLADAKSRKAARKARATNPRSILAVCGCYAQMKPEEVMNLCNADIVLGTGRKSRLVELVETEFQGRSQLVEVSGEERDVFDVLPAGSFDGRTRALIKVQDGCQNYCSYCIIPYARGKCRSMPLDTAASEAARLEKEGFKELTITGIEISSYGIDLQEHPSPIDMIERICQSAPHTRIRLSSLEPRTIDLEFCRRLKEYPNLCPHFHLSLQSGCDKVLKMMNRKYSTEMYLESCALLRETFPGCALTTDLIVGFPGETDEDFAETLSFLEKCAFSQAHIFPYSRRQGTAAFSMPGQLTRAEKEDRARKASLVCKKTRESYLRSLIGNTLPVLFEKQKGACPAGRCPQYCLVEAEGGITGEVMNVQIDALNGDHLRGTIIQENDRKQLLPE